MEKWANNTLRVLGIVVTSIILVLGGFLLLMLSLCSWSGGFGGGRGDKGQAIGYLVGLAVFLILAIFVIAKLAKGLAHSTGVLIPNAPDKSGPPQVESILHLSPASEDVIRYLIYSIVAAIVVSAFRAVLTVDWIVLGIRSGFGLRGGMFLFLVYQTPYAVLLVTLKRRPDRRVFTYTLAVPLVLIMLGLYSLPVALSFYLRTPLQVSFTVVTLGINSLILWLTWKAYRCIGYQLAPSSLVVAGVVVLLYFGTLQYLVVPLLLGFRWR